MKKLLASILMVGICLLNVTPLSAASDRVKIVDNNNLSKQLSEDGMHITNRINQSKSDLVNGKIAIEIIIDNSKNTEIFYVIDNSSKIKDKRNDLIDKIKEPAKVLEGYNAISQGIVTTSNGNISTVPLDTENIELQLEGIKNTETNDTEENLLNAIKEAESKFTEKADNKVIVVFTSQIPSNTEELTKKINELKEKKIKVIAYSIGMSDETTNFDSAFKDADYKDNLKEELNISSYLTKVTSYLPSLKSAIATTISYHERLLQNFDIVDLTTDLGQVKFENNKVIWEAGDITSNKVVKLTYTLKLKSVVDSSIVDNLTLKTNKQIIVTQSGEQIGTYPKNTDSGEPTDELCMPRIMILKEAVTNPVNPDTGIADYVVFGACILAVAAITILILNKKNQFNRI